MAKSHDRIRIKKFRPGSRAKFQALLRREFGNRTEAEMKSYADELRAEGKVEGRAEGQADLFLKQLKARFGAVPPAITRRVRKASAEELETWAIRILSAKSLERVFA